ncbi:hypothetical protein ACIBF1_22835 [Spirillospora sp. NPDC050679]
MLVGIVCGLAAVIVMMSADSPLVTIFQAGAGMFAGAASLFALLAGLAGVFDSRQL